jgi:hypothetical protein
MVAIGCIPNRDGNGWLRTERVLPSRDREGVGAVVFNGVTMGLRPTKGDKDAL